MIYEYEYSLCTEHISETRGAEQVSYFFWDFGNPVARIV